MFSNTQEGDHQLLKEERISRGYGEEDFKKQVRMLLTE